MNPLQMFGNMQNMMARFQQFQRQIQQQGINPQQQVEQLLRSGKMTQQQFENFKQIANMLTGNNRPM